MQIKYYTAIFYIVNVVYLSEIVPDNPRQSEIVRARTEQNRTDKNRREYKKKILKEKNRAVCLATY